MKIVVFIPARSGSKSIKDKNIKDLGGKPLLAYSIKSALDSGFRTIVSTDSEEYAKIAKEYGAEVMMRDPKLSQDNTPMLDVLKSEIPKTEADIVVLLQPTSPFRKKLYIKLAAEYLEKREEYDSVITVERVPEKYNPYQMFIDASGDKRVLFRKLAGWKEKLKGWFTGRKYKLGEYPIGQRITKRQDVTAWLPDGSVYAFRAKNLNGSSFYGENTLLIENEGTLNINEESDFIKAEEHLKNE